MTPRLLLCALVVTLSACGSYAGGGGGVPVIGGVPSTPCDPAIFSQGCSGITKVSCDATSSQWTSIGDCPAGQACIGLVDPSAPSSAKKIATCVAPGGGATDAGSGDAVHGDDTGTGDGKDGAATDSGETTPDTTGTKDSGGTTIAGGPWLKCVGEKCATQWGGCAADATCKIAALCVDGCAGDKKCKQLCFDNTSGGAQDKLISVIMCADQTGCKAGPAGPVCGNGKCEVGETSTSCSQDCKTNGPQCNNGICEDGESNATCPQDCKPMGPQCGDGKCESGETPQSCLADCKPPCGDGKCELGEAKNTCPQDCGPSTVCGNSVCEQGETASSCAKDCGPKTACGNGTCESGETASTCPQDCTGGASCMEQKCAATYQTCVKNTKCVGIIYFAIFNDCLTKNKCKDSACVTSKCGKESTSCQQDSGCKAVINCLTPCKDKACQDKCLDQAALTQYSNLGTCIQKNCPNG